MARHNNPPTVYGVEVNSPKEAEFVRQVLIDGNAARAAKDAGFSERRARQAGHELLQKPHIAAAIEAGRADLAQRCEVTQERVVAELAKVAFANILDYITVQQDGTAYLDLSQLTREQAAAVSQFDAEQIGVENTDSGPRPVRKVRVKLADKLGALDKLARHLGMYVEKVEHSGSVNVVTLQELVSGDGDTS